MITDFGILRPHPETDELQLAELCPGVKPDQVRAATGWDLRIADQLTELAPPTAADLACLRALHERTDAAHDRAVRIRLPTSNRV